MGRWMYVYNYSCSQFLEIMLRDCIILCFWLSPMKRRGLIWNYLLVLLEDKFSIILGLDFVYTATVFSKQMGIYQRKSLWLILFAISPCSAIISYLCLYICVLYPFYFIDLRNPAFYYFYRDIALEMLLLSSVWYPSFPCVYSDILWAPYTLVFEFFDCSDYLVIILFQL